ncbi:uncharacterized protein ColSpa_00830 [Colletotrichum spaethianum]|uniref:Uncharacterized protein n=1 Tax=Colletotrichum spaethianum TaxID=700344 RepID=A0AA37L640_9PEZI|nr:uncharacterized protein ColSpa_00830 [Colletotrichum spaethianum]GKT40649.1 hypothetical protein ColSpa_00830 [Colletotrichum spaethianum]
MQIYGVLENPGSSGARGDLATTRTFAHFLQKFEKSEGCDLKRVLTACAFFQRTVQYAVDDAQNVMRAQNLVGNSGGNSLNFSALLLKVANLAALLDPNLYDRRLTALALVKAKLAMTQQRIGLEADSNYLELCGV